MPVSTTVEQPPDQHAGEDEIASIDAKVGRLFWLLVIGFILAVVIVGFYVLEFSERGLSDQQDVWGQFGDYVGGVLNPVFGFLTLIAILWTITLQSKELRLSTEELRKSAAALDAQNATLKLQNFESTFFQLLRLHNDIVTAMDVTSGGAMHSEVRGRDCFGTFARELKHQLQQTDTLRTLEPARNTYMEFYKKRQRDLGHYFRLLYHIIKFVDHSSVENKKFYTNLVRAQLSSDELRILFFNCLSPLGTEKFKPLIEKYALLKTMPEDPFPSTELRAEYKPAAYAADARGSAAKEPT